MLIDYKIKHREDEHTNWRIAFQFSTVSWFLLIIYHILVTVRLTRRRVSMSSCLSANMASVVVDHHPHALA